MDFLKVNKSPGEDSAEKATGHRMSSWTIVFASLIFLAGCATKSEPENVDNSLGSVLSLGAVPTLADAEGLMRSGRYDAAVSKLSIIVNADPKDYDAQFLLGEALLKSGKPEDAVSRFGTVLNSTDHEIVAKQGLGLAFLQLGDRALAHDYLSQAIAADATLWRAQNALGHIYDEREAWSEAEAAYMAAISANPDAATVYNNLGVSYLLQERFGDAIQQFDKSLAIVHDSTVETNLRMAHALKGDYVAALVGTSNTGLSDALNNVGYAALLRGDMERAEAYFVRAMEISPSYHTRASENLRLLEDMKALGEQGKAS